LPNPFDVARFQFGFEAPSGEVLQNLAARGDTTLPIEQMVQLVHAVDRRSAASSTKESSGDLWSNDELWTATIPERPQNANYQPCVAYRHGHSREGT
jgi:hypothetical protein